MRWGLLLVAGLVVVLVGIALGLGLQSTPSYAAAESRASSVVVVSQAAAASSAASQQTAAVQTASQQTADLSSSIEVEKGASPLSATASAAQAARGEGGGNRSKTRTWGPPVLLDVPIAPSSFEKIYTGLRAVEMDYFRQPKRNDTVVKTFGLINDEAREEIRRLPYRSSAEVVEFILKQPDTVMPKEFLGFVERLRRELPVGDVYFGSRLEYAVLVVERNATTAAGPAADVVVLEDVDFRRFSGKYLGFEVDPCSNAILLPLGYNHTFAGGEEVEAFILLAWYGLASNTAMAYFHVNAILKIYLLKIDVVGAVGFVGRCFAESFTDVPPFKSYAFVEMPQEAWRYVYYRGLEFIYDRALQHPEKIEWLARWYNMNATRAFDWYREMLTHFRKELEKEAAELGLN